MSRKDPRRRMMVPLSSGERDALRSVARGGSLGDALRRVVQQAILKQQDMIVEGDVMCVDVLLKDVTRGLPLQLPPKTRAQLQRSARQQDCDIGDLVRAMLIKSLACSS